jgi:hypothetical protein
MKATATAFVAIAALLSSCGPATPDAKPGIEFKSIGRNLYAGEIPVGFSKVEIELAARNTCGSAPMCDVFGWRDKTRVAAALPMTDDEANALSFKYVINRTTSFQSTLWDCTQFPGTKPDACIAKDTVPVL